MIMWVVIVLRLRLFDTWNIATCIDILAVWIVAAFRLCRFTTAGIFARAV
jgi:hypothetical protein